MLGQRFVKRAMIGSLTLGTYLLTFGAGSWVFGSPPGGGFGRPSAGNWVNFGINAANTINRAQQQQRHQQHPPHQHQPHQQPQYYPQQPQQQLATPQAAPTPIQANAIPDRKVEPQKNAVPLADKIVPLRRREARCYQYLLSDNIDKAGGTTDAAWQQHQKAIGEQLIKSLARQIADEADRKQITELLQSGDFARAREQIDGLKLSKEDRDALAKSLEASQQIDQQLADLRTRLKEEQAWKDVQKLLEDLAASMTQLTQRTAANPQAPPAMDGVLNAIGELANLLIIRDILAQAGDANGPVRFNPIPAGQIPTGIIRVIYDPDLPAGAGLWINESVIIAGTGGRGELQTGIASAAEALGLPIAPGVPVADLGPDENPPKGGVLIGNPEENSGSIKYVLASVHPYELKTGYRQHLAGTQSWLIEFDRGGKFGRAKYTLAEGIYDFKVGEKGWHMVSRPLTAVIDNRDGTDDFHYVQDNKRQTIRAGEAKTIENKSTVIISFDRGGDIPTRKLLNKSGTYKVAVNIENNRYDLFAPVEPERTPAIDAVAGGEE